MTLQAAACAPKGENKGGHPAASGLPNPSDLSPHHLTTLRDLQAHQDHIYALKAMYTAQFGKNEGMCYAAIRELTVCLAAFQFDWTRRPSPRSSLSDMHLCLRGHCSSCGS